MSVSISSGKRVLIATCIVTVFATTAFGAVFNDLLGRDWQRLNGKGHAAPSEDTARSARRAFAGASVNWKDPRHGQSGRASVLRIYEQDGMPCAEVEHVFTTGNRYRYVLPFCRKDGEWKMAF
jgi:hypothetical protein